MHQVTYEGLADCTLYFRKPEMAGSLVQLKGPRVLLESIGPWFDTQPSIGIELTSPFLDVFYTIYPPQVSSGLPHPERLEAVVRLGQPDYS